MPCCEHMAQSNTVAPLSLLLLLLLLLLLVHLGLSDRDIVCQPIHGWLECHAPAPTHKQLRFHRKPRIAHPPFCALQQGKGGMQGNVEFVPTRSNAKRQYGLTEMLYWLKADTTNKREGRDRAVQKQTKKKVKNSWHYYPEAKAPSSRTKRSSLHMSVRQNVKNLNDEIMNHL